jgi:hypothetical protein
VAATGRAVRLPQRRSTPPTRDESGTEDGCWTHHHIDCRCSTSKGALYLDTTSRQLDRDRHRDLWVRAVPALDRVRERILGRFTRSEPRNRAGEYAPGLVEGLDW